MASIGYGSGDIVDPDIEVPQESINISLGMEQGLDQSQLANEDKDGFEEPFDKRHKNSIHTQ